MRRQKTATELANLIADQVLSDVAQDRRWSVEVQPGGHGKWTWELRSSGEPGAVPPGLLMKISELQAQYSLVMD